MGGGGGGDTPHGGNIPHGGRGVDTPHGGRNIPHKQSILTQREKSSMGEHTTSEEHTI